MKFLHLLNTATAILFLSSQLTGALPEASSEPMCPPKPPATSQPSPQSSPDNSASPNPSYSPYPSYSPSPEVSPTGSPYAYSTASPEPTGSPDINSVIEPLYKYSDLPPDQKDAVKKFCKAGPMSQDELSACWTMQNTPIGAGSCQGIKVTRTQKPDGSYEYSAEGDTTGKGCRYISVKDCDAAPKDTWAQKLKPCCLTCFDCAEVK